ncbi:hypothetical protein [Thalassobacillus sp. CUG 92003]|nr:hypothetical protein [Thalassobacillus sp. CUG 92003]
MINVREPTIKQRGPMILSGVTISEEGAMINGSAATIKQRKSAIKRQC